MPVEYIKPHNSVLFDFFSLIDVKLTVLKYINDEYRNQKLDYFHQEYIEKINFEKSKYDRMKHLPTDTFSSVTKVKFKNQTEALNFAQSLYFSREEDMLKHSIETGMPKLISLYAMAGNGSIISCTVRCDNQVQVEYIKEHVPKAKYIISSRKDCDIISYSRIINGHWEHLLEYEHLLSPQDNHPRSLLLLNYDENFNDNEHKAIKYDAILKFGYFHQLGMITAFSQN